MRALPLTALFAMTLLPGGTALARPVDAADREKILRSVDANAAQIGSNALKIWNLAEPGFKEMQSSQLLQGSLRSAGFKVTANVAGMPSAFIAGYRTGDGPVIAIMAEFDALPGISQRADATVATPLAGARAGHACGHNLLGAGGVGAAIAVAKWMASSGFKGEIRVYGAPAEEGGDGKAYMVRAGLFNDVDSVLHWHPWGTGGTTVLNAVAKSNIKTMFTFHGTSSHAAATPWNGRSALAAAEIMDVSVNYMRQFVPDGTRIHGVVLDGGKAPNVIPATTTSNYYVRHQDVNVVHDLQARLIKAAQGAATATETTVTWEVQGGVYPVLLNDTLNHVAQGNLEAAASELNWDAADTAYIQAVQKNLGITGAPNDPHAVSPLDRPQSDPGGSSDVGDISYMVPTVGMLVASWPDGVSPHSWASDGASGSALGVKGAVTAAKALALTAVELMQSPDEIAAAKAELVKRRGKDFQYKSLFGDRAPALNFTDAAMNGQ